MELKKILVETGNGVTGNVEDFSNHSATQGSRKEPSIANSRSSRRHEIEKEIENLIAKRET